jgi:hypothetical protein
MEVRRWTAIPPSEAFAAAVTELGDIILADGTPPDDRRWATDAITEVADTHPDLADQYLALQAREPEGGAASMDGYFRSQGNPDISQ